MNVAKQTEQTRHEQLTIVENDPFNCNVNCENRAKVREVYGYEQIVEILNFKKRKQVLNNLINKTLK